MVSGNPASVKADLSSWTGSTVEPPIDAGLHYEELMKRLASSRQKTNVASVVADTAACYTRCLYRPCRLQ